MKAAHVLLQTDTRRRSRVIRALPLSPVKTREIEVEVLPKSTESRALRGGEDPLVAFVARLMDTAFSIPGTKIRFGLDPLLGLLPGLGDTVTALVSALLIAQSARYGVPKVILARMAGNVLLNTAVGAIPVVGDLFSVWFKSNAKNYALLRNHAGARRQSTGRDWLFVIALLAAIFVFLAVVIIGAVTILQKIFAWLS